MGGVRSSNTVWRVGLTGGIASGKSTVAALFAHCGVPVIDADLVARRLTAAGSPLVLAIADALGGQYVDAGGHLRRRDLRERVFADGSARAVLEDLLHPAIRAAMEADLARITAPYGLLVIPLLAEARTRPVLDRVLVVDCPVALQRERLLARDGITPGLAEQMLAAQASREARLALAHDVVDNTGDPDLLSARVADLHARYLSAATAAHPSSSSPRR